MRRTSPRAIPSSKRPVYYSPAVQCTELPAASSHLCEFQCSPEHCFFLYVLSVAHTVEVQDSLLPRKFFFHAEKRISVHPGVGYFEPRNTFRIFMRRFSVSRKNPERVTRGDSDFEMEYTTAPRSTLIFALTLRRPKSFHFTQLRGAGLSHQTPLNPPESSATLVSCTTLLSLALLLPSFASTSLPIPRVFRRSGIAN